MWTGKHALADACYARMAVHENGEYGLGSYMNTPIVAMDIKATVGAFAKSRKYSLSQYRRDASAFNIVSVDKIPYWGFSYGTLLGQTLPAMYPDLVGRMILAGVIDADHHYAVNPVSEYKAFSCLLNHL